MDSALKNIYSVINSHKDAPDAKRVFTFIEFIKEFGYDNSPSTFLSIYKNYLSEWAKQSDKNNIISDKELVRQNMIDTLKSIVLNYSSYEEQDFIAHLDWDNERHVQAIVPFFVKKIRNICDFYKTKRNDIPLIINKNKLRGSRESIEQIIYDKIVDFYFNNKNLAPQISQLKRDLTVSIEQYVDVYSDYFDIPRHKKCTNETREAMIEANINNVRYEDYLEVAKVITDTLFSGDVYLIEIPLIAQISLDFSADCAGDLRGLRDELLYNSTLNLVSLNDQIALRRALYRKYLGCDLYYIYADGLKNITMDKLVIAENPSGNLLNCGTADTATIESNDIKLLSQIGLFFKPDKTGILQISADSYEWDIDTTKIKPDSFYIFPDPYKYGDIGNNKSSGYPLIMEYKLDSYIKNISSGQSKDDPLNYICNVTWNTYQTKQDEDYYLINNKNFDYSFTNLANIGIIDNYKTDLFGNEYCLVKGYEIMYDSYGNISGISTPSKFPLPAVNVTQNKPPAGIIINGGYFVDPRFEYKCYDLKFPFDYKVRQRFSNDYIWTGLKFGDISYNTPDATSKKLSCGTFSAADDSSSSIKFVDHYQDKNVDNSIKDKNFVSGNVLDNFKTNFNNNLYVEEKDVPFNQIHNQNGNCIWIKETSVIDSKIKSLDIVKKNNGYDLTFSDITQKVKPGVKVKSFDIFKNYIIVYTDAATIFIKYSYDGETKYQIVYVDELENNTLIKPLYIEKYRKLYILKLITATRNSGKQQYFKVEIKRYGLEDNLEPELLLLVKENFTPEERRDLNPQYITCEEINNNFDCETSFIPVKDVVFSYNTALNKFAIVYIQHDSQTIPTIYEHQFKLFDTDNFRETLETTVYTSKYSNLSEIDMSSNPWSTDLSTITNFSHNTLGETEYPFFIEYN